MQTETCAGKISQKGGASLYFKKQSVLNIICHGLTSPNIFKQDSLVYIVNAYRHCKHHVNEK